MVTKSSSGYRALEILLGLVALVIGILVLIFPTGFAVTVVVLFGIALLAIGILRLGTAAFRTKRGRFTRAGNAIIGIVALVVAVLVLFFPLVVAQIIVILIGIGLLIYGLGRIYFGWASGRNLASRLRWLIIITGLLVVIFALVIIFVPAVGIFTYAFFVSLSLILIGIDSIASGIIGIPLT